MRRQNFRIVKKIGLDTLNKPFSIIFSIFYCWMGRFENYRLCQTRRMYWKMSPTGKILLFVPIWTDMTLFVGLQILSSSVQRTYRWLGWCIFNWSRRNQKRSLMMTSWWRHFNHPRDMCSKIWPSLSIWIYLYFRVHYLTKFPNAHSFL